MYPVKGKIIFIDFVDKQSKKKIDKQLRKLSNSQEDPMQMSWNRMSDSGGKYQDWKFSEIPESLYFFTSFKVRVLQYARFPFAYQLLIEGTFSDEILEEIDKKNDEDARKLIIEFRQKLWKFHNENIKGLLVQKRKDFNFFDGCSVLNFKFKLEKTEEMFELTSNGDVDIETPYQIRNSPVLEKYGVNSIGLISLYRVYKSQFDLFAQLNAVFHGHDYDFTGTAILQFSSKPENFEDDVTQEHERLFKMIFAYLWLKYRISETPQWKTKVDELSSQIKQYSIDSKKLELEKQHKSLLEIERLFLTDYADTQDENRSFIRYLDFDRERSNDRYWKEIPILESENFPSIKKGIFGELSESISWYVKYEKEEFDNIREHLQIVSEFTSRRQSWITSRSNDRLSDSNENLNKKLVWLTVVLVFLGSGTFILAYMQWVESSESSNISLGIKDLNESVLATMYKDFQLELEYQIFPPKMGKVGGLIYDLYVNNTGDFDTLVRSEWFISHQRCNPIGENYTIDRFEAIANFKSETEVLERGVPVSYNLKIEKIYPNYTNMQPFKMELWVTGTPVTPKGEPIEFFNTTKHTWIQFVYDEKLQNWIPEQTWEDLKCSKTPRDGTSFITLDTANKEEFRRWK